MLKDKTAFITGTNRGIGKVLIEEFAKNGAHIIAHARQENQDFFDFISSISTPYGVHVSPVFFDMTDTNAMKECLKKIIIKDKIGIDILVNNAGMAHGSLFQASPVSKIKEVFETNLFAQMELTQLVLKSMMRRKSGSIINMGSILGLDLRAGSCGYGLSKATLMAWTKSLAADLEGFNIRVNAIAPGLIDTQMAQLMEEKASQRMLSDTIMKRLGTPKEIASTVVFLASEEASFINGQVFRVDGGIA